MHFEILVEDQSGKKALDILTPKILETGRHTWSIHFYRGIGRIPPGLTTSDPSKRILLAQLPRLLRGYGKTFHSYPADYKAAVLVVCDLDNKCLKGFLEELRSLLSSCSPKPIAHFCIAIEEGEAWLLGDIAAVLAAFPKAKKATLTSYINDSICGTWETLADAVYTGGASALAKKGWQAIGAEKSHWAEKICPNMDIAKNKSPSFNHFLSTIVSLSEEASS